MGLSGGRTQVRPHCFNSTGRGRSMREIRKTRRFCAKRQTFLGLENSSIG